LKEGNLSIAVDAYETRSETIGMPVPGAPSPPNFLVSVAEPVSRQPRILGSQIRWPEAAPLLCCTRLQPNGRPLQRLCRRAKEAVRQKEYCLVTRIVKKDDVISLSSTLRVSWETYSHPHRHRDLFDGQLRQCKSSVGQQRTLAWLACLAFISSLVRSGTSDLYLT
jgi:hypothetical protein